MTLSILNLRPRISIIISLTGHSQVGQMVASLARQTVDLGNDEVLVADATGDPATQRELDGIDPDAARRINLRRFCIAKGGRASASNEALRHARGELYLFLGDDFVPQTDWVEQHLRLHLEHPQKHVVGVGPSRYAEHLLREPFVGWLAARGTEFGPGYYGPESERSMSRFFYCANTSIKRALIWKAGLFDIDFPYDAIEDHELGVRLARLDMEVKYLPAASVIHDHPATFEEWRDQLFRIGESIALFEAKYPGQHVPLRGCRFGERGHRWRALGWQLVSRLTRSQAAKENYWRETLCAQFLKGRRIETERLATSDRSLRRIEVSLPATAETPLELSLARQSLVWEAENGSENAGGLYPFDNPDSESVTVLSQGTACLKIRNPFGAPWVYFRIDPLFVQWNRELTIECELSTPAGHQVCLEYDSDDVTIARVEGMPGAFKRADPVAITETSDGWGVYRFQLSDLCASRRINGGEFRLLCEMSDGESFLLRRVEVARSATASNDQPQRLVNPQSIHFAPSPQPDVTIVIPVHNKLIYTLQCLQSISQDQIAHSYEVVVVDDGSADGTGKTLKGIRGLHCVELGVNQGFSKACNHGAAAARGRWLLFLNNDTVVQPGWLDELMAVATAGQGIGVVGSRLIYPQTGEIQHAGVAINESGVPYHIGRDRPNAIDRSTETFEVDAVTGACLLTARDLFQRLDGFDEGYLQEYQDIDYCLKVIADGQRVMYCGTSVALHYELVTRNELCWRSSADQDRFLNRWPARAA